MMGNPIDDVFDTRDLIEYYEYLQQELVDGFQLLFPDSDIDDIDDILALDKKDYEKFFNDNYLDIEHYQEIKDFHDELNNYSPDFEYGETVICETYWVRYCEDLVCDLGCISDETPPFIRDNIDWEGVAKDLAVDYTTVEYDGNDYYIR